MLKVPEKYRVKVGQFASDESYGNNGVFIIPMNINKTIFAYIMVSDGMDWEHLSVHLVLKNGKDLKRTPTWEEMCQLKDMFWDSEDCVIQYHPPKSMYVNQHKYCLHLWRQINNEIPISPYQMVGSKTI